MRSTTWITVLVGLFIFQSLWNVAAAFCIHEEQPQIQQSYHFGHHQNTLCTNDSGHQQSKQFKKVVSDIQLGEDHQDHVPSMTHLIVQNNHTVIIRPNLDIAFIPKFDWQNHYRAPDLYLHNPPPEFSPLMVG